MTFRHYAIGFAALVLALPVLGLLFFLLPVLLPLALAVPFIIAASARKAANQDITAVVTPVLAAPIGSPSAGLVLQLRQEVGTLEHAHAA